MVLNHLIISPIWDWKIFNKINQLLGDWSIYYNGLIFHTDQANKVINGQFDFCTGQCNWD